MSNLTMTPDEVAELNDRHAHARDKFFRMFAGASSNLRAVTDGVVELDIRIVPNKKRPITVERLVENIVNSWHHAELDGCHTLRAYIRRASGPTGFAVSIADSYGGDLVTAAGEIATALARIADPDEDPETPVIAREYSLLKDGVEEANNKT